MAAIIALRWVSDLYRGVITGLERLVWLNAFNIVIATLRFVVVVPLFIYVGTRPTQFFGYQLAVAFIEIGVLMHETYQHLTKSGKTSPIRIDAATSSRGASFFPVCCDYRDGLGRGHPNGQVDSFEAIAAFEYAYFTLAVLVASGVMVFSLPISGPLIPRMVALNSEGKEEDLIRIYRNATQLVAVMTVPAAAVLAMFFKGSALGLDRR